MGIIANYKFSNRKHPWTAVAASVFGVISLVSIVLAVYLTYKDGGQARFRYGVVCVFSVLLAIAGEAMALAAYYSKDTYRFFPMLGIILNAIVLLVELYIVFAGVNGVV